MPNPVLKHIRDDRNNVTYDFEALTDSTLSIQERAADAKAVRDAIETVENDIENLNIVYYFRNEVLNSTNTTKELSVNIPRNHRGTLNFTVKNTSQSSGYAQVYLYGSNNEQAYGYSQFITAGQTLSVSDVPIIIDIAKIKLGNPSAVNSLQFDVWMSYKEDFFDALDEVDSVSNRAFINYGTQKIGYLGSDGSIHTQSSGTNRYIEIYGVTNGEQFIYSGAYSGWSLVFGYYADNTAVSLLTYGSYDGKVITINDASIVTVRAWSDIAVKDLEFYSLNSLEARVDILESKVTADYGLIVVDVNGHGNFTDIASAIAYAKNTYDVDDYPVDIYIKDGVYTVTPTADYPFYALDKGANKINIRGQSRENTIIRCICTSTAQGIALNIGGECTIENLTIENLADASYTSETILEGNHRPYCIHNDSSPVDETAKYKTVVRNCTLYSECMTPIGAGLRHNQLQIYDNVQATWAEDAVDAQITSEYTGCVYVHAPGSSSAVALGVQFIDCIMVSECERPALSLPDVDGSQSMADVEQTFVRNVTATKGNIEVSLSAPNNKSFRSKGNSASALNY